MTKTHRQDVPTAPPSEASPAVARFRDLVPSLAPRLARIPVVFVVCGFVLIAAASQFLVDEPAGRSRSDAGDTLVDVGLTVLYGLGLLAIHLGVLIRPRDSLDPRVRYATLVVEGGLVFLPILQFDLAWMGMPGFLVGCLLLLLRPAASVPLAVAVVSAMAWWSRVAFGAWFDAGYTVVATTLTGLIVYGLTRLYQLVVQLHAAQDTLTRLAVADERARFSRDVHDLLGLSLSATMLKTELVAKLLADQPLRARRELDEIMQITRSALAESRQVASGFRHLALAEECRSAVSVLTTADVDVTLVRDDTALPRPVCAVLATVLRECVTNILRHSDATWCTITIDDRDGTARLEVVNDGVRAPSAALVTTGTGSGVTNLGDRVRSLGGQLEGGIEGGRRYRLRVTVPPARPGPADERPGRPDHQRDPDAEPLPTTERFRSLVPSIPLRVARLMMVGVLSVFVLVAAANMGLAGGKVGNIVTALVCGVALLAVHLGVVTRPRESLDTWVRYAAPVVEAILLYAPISYLTAAWIGLPGFLVGCLLLLHRPAVSIPLAVAVVATMGWWSRVAYGDWFLPLYTVEATALTGSVVWGLTRLYQLVLRVHAAQHTLVRLAVARERDRFSRDVHDLLGLSLSATMLKTELVAKLLTEQPEHPERARRELDEVMQMTRRALAESRQVATGYRSLTLAEECRSAASVLTTADVDVSLDRDDSRFPTPVSVVLAAVLRECVTNVLRHSDATWCTISIGGQDGTAVLEVVNDGVREPGPVRPSADTVRGLVDLGDRVRSLGGDMQGGVGDGRLYRLRLGIPLERHDRAGATPSAASTSVVGLTARAGPAPAGDDERHHRRTTSVSAAPPTR